MRARMELRGPCSYKKVTNSFYNIKNPQIVDACIEISGTVIPLQQNELSVELIEGELYVYHFFQYFDEHGKVVWGRWFHEDMPRNTFKRMKRVFRHVMIDDVDETPTGVIVRIFFTEKAAEELRHFTDAT